ncbi:alpha/beta hydrolase [Kitasatospora saccharophila]|uniref:Alpha/beta hydrolase n=2 Tax=Kitasatospora saccharophila TaxID=407973 RepID=A0ABP5IFW4_9ACTN
MIMHTSRSIRRVLPAAALALLLAACGSSSHQNAAQPTGSASPSASPSPSPKPTGADDPALKGFYTQQIAWAPCADDPATDKVDESALQCGRLKVPLDYAAPAGEGIEVALSRKPATGSDRLGSLLLNPGGPGGSGIEQLQYSGDAYKDLNARYDLVGFDPRGVGASTAVHCLDDAAHDTWALSDDRADDRGKAYADACAANSGKLLAHVGTTDAARDLDVLRGALGDPKLNYLGFSYGTYLGASYAEQFPDRTGRLVLDGAVDPTADQLDLLVQQFAGFEKSLKAFAADCAKQSQCSLGKDPDKAAQKLASFLDGLREHPLKVGKDRELTETAGWTATLSMLYGNQQSWTYLRNAIDWAILRDKGDYLLNMADGYNGRDDKGHYSNMFDAYTAIHCDDPGAETPGADRLQAALAEAHEQAPLVSAHFTEANLFDPDCRSWPYRSTEQPHVVKATGSAPILVVGSTGDPATPYAWSEKLASGFANATLLTRDGDGHTAYNKSTCIKDAVNGFLVNGVMPAAGTHCPTS